MSKSLLTSKESTGGAIAREGFSYQDSYALVRLPQWLSRDGFIELISETVGDIEVCHFTPQGVRRTFIEAKNHGLTPAAFWKEVKHFKTCYERQPDVYERFALVCTEFSDTVMPLLRILGRVRGVGAAAGGGPLLDEARQEFLRAVARHGQDETLADFVFSRVFFEEFDAAAAETRFPGEFLNAFPQFNFLSAKAIRELQAEFSTLVSRSTQQPVKRRELEEAVVKALEAEAEMWTDRPSEVLVLRSDVDVASCPQFSLSLDARAVTGPERGSLGQGRWDEFFSKAREVGDFLIQTRIRRRVALPAEVRMSAAISIGAALKATRGHLLVLRHRDSVFDLGCHERSWNQFFSTGQRAGTGAEGVVSIQIGPSTADDVTVACQAFGLTAGPQLWMQSSLPISDLTTLNQAVAEAKEALARFRSAQGLEVLHLFVKGPSFFAMALGHRLNGLPQLQLYDWMGSEYASTARLDGSE